MNKLCAFTTPLYEHGIIIMQLHYDHFEQEMLEVAYKLYLRYYIAFSPYILSKMLCLNHAKVAPVVLKLRI
jgi:hypothetical protein